tara:strand:- start:242 stop:478 length:237 start_codon:yes stop_codon:yes gene_type:complete
MTKITEKQLELVQDQQTKLADLLNKIGVLEIQKQNITGKVQALSDEIEQTKADLEKEYGSINIDLKDGTYTEIKKDAE